jgi:hypothetical protein
MKRYKTHRKKLKRKHTHRKKHYGGSTNKNSKRTYFTTNQAPMGFGAQYQSMMSGLAFADHNNYLYLHTPFTGIEHNLDVDKVNKFIGMNNDELEKNGLMPRGGDEIISKGHAPEVHFAEKPSIYYTDKVLKKLRDFYHSTEKPQIEPLDIAVHIRRGDVNPGLANRYTNNDMYKKLIPILKNEYPGKKITIVSQGKLEDFNDLGLEKEGYMLNTDFYDTFHNLVCAKVLIVAKSSYSYSAALLNANTVYCPDFWHKPLDHWKSIETVINKKG